jgi:hypothetical protein
LAYTANVTVPPGASPPETVADALSVAPSAATAEPEGMIVGVASAQLIATFGVPVESVVIEAL